MVKVKAKNQAGVTVQVSCPSTYREVKLRQYVRILKEWDQDKDIADRDYFKLFNILTDGHFTNFERSVENEIALMNCIGWVIVEDFQMPKQLPKVLEYQGKLISIPENPGELSIGQNIQLRRDYMDKATLFEENLSIATAIYLQPIIDGKKFNLKRAEEIAKELDEYPACIIYPIGFFLLKRALKFGMKHEKTSLLPRVNPMNSLKRWLRTLLK